MSATANVVFCTCPDLTCGQVLAEQLVKKRLAACVNIIPAVKSIFRWQNQVETAEECLLCIKTITQNYAAIETFIRQQHPYAIPEIIMLPIAQGLPDYLQWMEQSCDNIAAN